VPCPPSLKYQAVSSQARLKSCWALPPWLRPLTPPSPPLVLKHSDKLIIFLLLGRDHAGESEGVGPGVHEADAALQVLGEDAHRGDEEDPRLPQGILPGLHTSSDNFCPVPSNAVTTPFLR
jgi:hypothetical protein